MCGASHTTDPVCSLRSSVPLADFLWGRSLHKTLKEGDCVCVEDFAFCWAHAEKFGCPE